jgi:putative ABC transport system permease protein
MLRQDLRYAVRMLARNPGFTAVALLTLALGVGANTAIFSIIDTVLLRGAPVRDIDHLAVLWETDRNTGTTREPASLPDALDYRQKSQLVEQIGLFLGGEVNFTPERGEPLRLQTLEITDNLLPMLGVSAAIGRSFNPGETTPGGARIVVLSDGLWTRAFGRDPGVVGRVVRIDDQPYTVIGVMAPAADFGVFQILSAADYSRAFADRGARAAVDIWLPFQYSTESLPRSTHPIFMLGRVRGSTDSVQTELAGIASDLERQFPENRGRGIFVEPLSEVVFGPVRPGLLVLLGAVGLVLLVACVNVCEPAARARHIPAARGRGAPGTGRERPQADDAIRDRRPRARIGGDCTGRGTRRRRRETARRAGAGRHPSHLSRFGRPPRSARDPSRGVSGGTALRHGAIVPGTPRRCAGHAEG